jgi:hypothetical protein
MRRVIRGVGHLRRQFTAFELSSTPPVSCYLPDTPPAACLETGRQLAIVSNYCEASVRTNLDRVCLTRFVQHIKASESVRPRPDEAESLLTRAGGLGFGDVT